MRNKPRIEALSLVLLLVLVPCIHAMADPVAEPGSGNPSTAAETQPEASDTAQPGKPSPGVGEISPSEPFIPSETISTGSAVSFPVDI
jgi:hypothetical protein